MIDIPILDTRKYQEMDGINQLIMDVVLQLLSWLKKRQTILNKPRLKGLLKLRKKGSTWGGHKLI
ncbi:hypothetical protein C162_22043 [Paenibacillus sp. FSL R7-269]|uniref:hypothetical protein n=1 Tax=Paenibacillus sp. FSL R7-269 TaxID=1226755 RepID=UPI0003E2BC62|nr:hypothetical protein [Paenibacillus sp. FSL R7-269]ETT45263.1 hypothetical protein C162_22043 [Paenibacillus sp. FSL R7-269]